MRYREVNFKSLYQNIGKEFHHVIDYVTGLQIADKLSEDVKREFKAKELLTGYSISIIENDVVICFIISKISRKIDIEIINIDSIRKHLFEYKFKDLLIEEIGLNLNEGLTLIDFKTRFAYISLVDIPSVEQIIGFMEMIK